MAEHLKTCFQCRAILATYSRLAKSIASTEALPSDEKIEAASSRVWAKLTESKKTIPDSFEPKIYRQPQKVWNWKVTMPLPAAAAAALIVAVMFFALLGIRLKPQPNLQDLSSQAGMAGIPAGMGLDDRGMVQIDDMSSVLQYLSNQEGADYMIIRLPETKRFSRGGEPALINAADYSRRSFSR
jgi:hypothetical protein